MKQWNLGDLIDRLKFVVSFNDDQTDQDFIGPAADTDKHFRWAINEAYVDEIEEASQICDNRWFYRNLEGTWAANAVTYDLPESVETAQLVAITDTTNDALGEPVWITGRHEGALRFWKDSNTIQWGTTGPASARTLLFTYVGQPIEMTEDSDVPDLLPSRFRHVLVWAAAIKLRAIADEAVPPDFVRQRNQIRERLHKALSMGRPTESGYPGIRNTDPDSRGTYPW